MEYVRKRPFVWRRNEVDGPHFYFIFLCLLRPPLRTIQTRKTINLGVPI